jgi:release factor glutamine methyltransferase
MNENSRLLMPVINDWLKVATSQLEALSIPSARLDAEIILAHSIRKNRTYLHAHPDELLQQREIEIAESRLLLRLDRVPIAYIIGHKDFYGRRFKVTPATLVPRPESEDLVEVALSLLPKNETLFDSTFRIIDVGTGTGCIGITIKLEAPETEISLTDIDPFALKIAASNATQLGADVHIIKSDLLQSYPFTPDMIVANLPYVDSSWERSPETNHEPEKALFAIDGGLALIKKLIEQASSRLRPSSPLVLEADPTQHDAIIEYGRKNKFALGEGKNYVIVLIKN